MVFKKETGMKKKQYTKKQIVEAIAYWEKQLAESGEEALDEGSQESQLNKTSSLVKKQLESFDSLYNIEKIVFVVQALNKIESAYREFAKADLECGELADAIQDAALSISDAARKAARENKL